MPPLTSVHWERFKPHLPLIVLLASLAIAFVLLVSVTAVGAGPGQEGKFFEFDPVWDGSYHNPESLAPQPPFVPPENDTVAIVMITGAGSVEGLGTFTYTGFDVYTGTLPHPACEGAPMGSTVVRLSGIMTFEQGLLFVEGSGGYGCMTTEGLLLGDNIRVTGGTGVFEGAKGAAISTGTGDYVGGWEAQLDGWIKLKGSGK